MLRLGVVVTILTLAVDPFSQQLVQLEQTTQYVNRLYGSKATSPYAQNYTLGTLEAVGTVNSSEKDEPPVNIVATKPHVSMEAAILSGFSQPIGKIRGESPSHCPSGNCTWSPFDSLAVCSRCDDVTSRLARVDNFTAFFDLVEPLRAFGSGVWLGEDASAYTLPNGHFLPNFHGCFQYIGDTENPVCPLHVMAGGTPTLLMTSHGTGNLNKTVSMKDLSTLIWSMSFIQMDELEESETPRPEIKDIDHEIHGETRKQGPWDSWPDTPVSAKECALYWCVKTLEPYVENNIFDEAATEAKGLERKPDSWDVIGSEKVAPENLPSDPESLEFNNKTSYLRRNPLSLYFPDHHEHQTLYNITDNAVWSLNAFFQDVLRKVWDVDGEALKLVRKEYLPNAAVMFNGWAEMEGMRPSMLGAIWDWPSAGLTSRFDAIATSMTNEIRSVAFPSPYPNYMDGEYLSFTAKDVAEGRISVQTVIYRTEWYWIALHGVILLGGIVFSAATLMEAGRSDVPVWKNHSVAAVSQGTHLPVANLIRDAKTTKDMEGAARKGAVKLAVPEKTPLLESSDGEADDDEPPRQARTS